MPANYAKEREKFSGSRGYAGQGPYVATPTPAFASLHPGATNIPLLRGSGRSDNGKANDLSSLWTLVVVSPLVRMIMQGSNCVLSIYDLVMNFERKIKACRSKQIYAGFCDL